MFHRMTTASSIAAHSAFDSLPGFSALTGPVARGLLALPFLISGAMHFPGAEQMAAIVPGWLPGGVFWVYLTGVALVAGAIGLFSRRWAVPAALGLAALMGTFALTVHLPAMFEEATRQMGMVGFMKDLGLAGGLLILAGRR
jgi:putative oxidoreductase